MSQIFISYTGHDREVKNELVSHLEKEKDLKPWDADHDIQSGNIGTIDIFKNLQDSDYFLLVMSKDSKDSKWVEAETYAWFAIRGRKRFFPFRIDDQHKREDFHREIRSIQDIKYDYNKNDSDEVKTEKLNKVTTEIKQIIENQINSKSPRFLKDKKLEINLVTRQLISIFINNINDTLLRIATKKAYRCFSKLNKEERICTG